MRFVPELGVAAPELGWVPSPTFALRRQAILDRVTAWRPGRVLEMGCGAGAILYDFGQMGFFGVGVETSERARAVAASILADEALRFTVYPEVPQGATGFDYLVSFEVLEHIEEDVAALRGWVECLRGGGTCLISVPAHPERWNVTDVLAGHYRRYTKAQILQCVEDAGLTPTYVSTYGWPVTWLIERVRVRVRERQLRKRGLDVKDIARGDSGRTADSGVERATELKLFPYYSGMVGRMAFKTMAHLQRPFYGGDKGISYLIEAKKSTGPR